MWAVGIVTYILLCGFPPFFSKKEYKDENFMSNAPFWLFFNDNTEMLQQEIMAGKVEFPEPFWSRVSPEAKEFVSGLLRKNPGKRFTAEQGLRHVWIVKVGGYFGGDSEVLGGYNPK
jgi:serine/threonine protein kinase